MYRIGELSRLCGLSKKALRLYHERGTLVPHEVDFKSGYRHYSDLDLERAIIIKCLRDMDFSLADIDEI